MTVWSSLDVYDHFPKKRDLARNKINGCLKWWKGQQKMETGEVKGLF